MKYIRCPDRGIRFAHDSPVEGDGFEPSVPLPGSYDVATGCPLRPHRMPVTSPPDVRHAATSRARRAALWSGTPRERAVSIPSGKYGFLNAKDGSPLRPDQYLADAEYFLTHGGQR